MCWLIYLFSGFSSEQAEALTKAYADVMNMTLDHQKKYMVTKPQQVYKHAHTINVLKF